MKERGHDVLGDELKTAAAIIASVVVLAGISNFAFTSEQKDWIRERDGDRCNFPERHHCSGPCQVHHILPQSYARKHGINPDYADNGINICDNAHQTLVHNVVFQEGRDAKNWNPRWDQAMKERVRRNTERFRQSHHWRIFPASNHRR